MEVEVSISPPLTFHFAVATREWAIGSVGEQRRVLK